MEEPPQWFALASWLRCYSYRDMYRTVKLIAKIKLQPSATQAASLRSAMERFNEACNWLGEQAFIARTADKYALQAAHYTAIRNKFSLPSQMAIRVIAKVCAAYKRDKNKQTKFIAHGSVPYDQRILAFKASDRVSISTIDGRLDIPFVAGDHHRTRLEGKRGQSDLVLRNGCWYLFVIIDVTEGAPVEPKGWLGVDLGIVNLATDSDGVAHLGAGVEDVRVRTQKIRAALQSCGTRSAKRHLKKIGKKEARFRSNTNHCISKKLVAKAKGTDRGIALEDLSGIRGRVTVRHAHRARHGSWSFFQMRSFVEYKAKLVGVAVVLVDPRDTSRTCIACNHCDKANRKSQSEFVCKSCGFAANADYVGAANLARRAAVNQPIVSSYDRVKRLLAAGSSRSSGASHGL